MTHTKLSSINSIITSHPWLIPLVWFISRKGCREFTISELSKDLGVSGRLARSLAYYGVRVGLLSRTRESYSATICPRNSLNITRHDRVFVAVLGESFFVAKVGRRRIKWFTVPRWAVEGEGEVNVSGKLRARARLVGRVLKSLS